MSIHLIIDGYNLIRQSPALARLDARDLQQGREALLEWLAAYRRIKGHAVTVVFDGWESGDFTESRDRVRGMTIIYSRRGEKADEVIKRLARREGQRAVVVSSDHEIQEYVERGGGTTLSAAEFELRLMLTATGAGDKLDGEEEGGGHLDTHKKGPAHRLSKKDRQRRSRTKKV